MNPTDHTTFDIENTALVLIDHQVGTIGLAGELLPEEREQLKMWVLVVAHFAQYAGVPVVLTSGQEDQQQGPLLPELEKIVPEAFAARVKRQGVINAWDDENFVAAIEATGKCNLVMAGVTTDVCLVPPALSARKAGHEATALLDISAATTRTAAQNSRELLRDAGAALLSMP
ncbi:isochorismatase family protein [Phycicoccus sp. CSK15P-2]|uniref:isochorismatase family protein n=1 Tax=Phycicoccus sp. CSK15P-2 TaxID=2807627 RepID=UPI00194E12C2|nr:isochorismatase family protein [Phycicoccus sp. CSK15P-2]MBM6402657.1 isochorismatase family protein [Phycicoccus sp. CSK15P-2]